MTDDDPPFATSIMWGMCGHCPNLHVDLLDADDCVIATAVFSRSMLERMLENLPEEHLQ